MSGPWDPEVKTKGCLLGLVGIIVMLGLGLPFLYKNISNYMRYGVWTSNTQSAIIQTHMSDPTLFAQLARQAQISLVSSHISTEDGIAGSINVTLVYSNGSGRAHLVELSSVRVRGILNGSRRTVWTNCDIVAGASFTIPAHSTIRAGECYSDSFTTVHGRASIVRLPRVEAIDNLPVTGGPMNTPWKYECSTSKPENVVFSNSNSGC